MEDCRVGGGGGLWHSGGLHGGQGAAVAAPRNDFYGSAGVGGGLRRDPDRAEKPAGAGVSGQIQAEDQTQDLNFSAKLLPPSLT